ncbi:C4-dicarboxylate ABC transporter permease [Deltaproteobacteria bacterium Smac51]|nr:C4-dicarboxylate ABC transporter permease [Deltaproteobacteria bacterium Smac51]
MSSSNASSEPAILRGLSVLESTLVTVSLMLMIIVVFLQVFFRYVVHYSLPWSEELARYLMTWVVFIGASMGAREGVHIGVAAFVNIMPKAFQKFDIIFSGLCSVAFGLAMSYVGYLAIARIARMGQISPAMEIPMWIAYLPILLGSLFMSIRFAQAMIEEYRNFDKIKENEEAEQCQ